MKRATTEVIHDAFKLLKEILEELISEIFMEENFNTDDYVIVDLDVIVTESSSLMDKKILLAICNTKEDDVGVHELNEQDGEKPLRDSCYQML